MSTTRSVRRGSALEPDEVQALRHQMQGRVLLPRDDGYDRACLTWDARTFDQHPALVAVPAVSADVLAAVVFARKHELPIAVLGGGHGHPRPAEGAVLVNFADMRKVEVSRETSTARVEPGALASDVIAAAHPFGLAPLTGFAPGVGITGFLLGGGIGWLTRQYGPGAAGVRRIDLVTADGRLWNVDADVNPDLFWGLRGGGGNLGIVTELECALYPVDTVFGGQVVYPIETGRTVLNAYLDWAHTVPDELTSAFRILQVPPTPDAPPPIRGRTVIMIMACVNGGSERGEDLVRPMRSLGTPLLDTFGSLPYTELGTIANDPPVAPPLYAHSDGGAMRAISAAAVETLLTIAADPASGVVLTEIRQLGGALDRAQEDAMVFTLRHAPFYLNLRAEAPSLEALTRGQLSIATIMTALQSDMSGAKTLNFLDYNALDVETTDIDRTRAAYTPDTYRRLVGLKNAYDPENAFRFAHPLAL